MEERREKLREADKIKISDLRFEENTKLKYSGKEEGKTFHKLHVVGMNDDLWDRVQ